MWVIFYILCLDAKKSCWIFCMLTVVAPPGSSVPWDFPGREYWSGLLFHAQEIFPTKNQNPSFTVCEQNSLPLKPPGAHSTQYEHANVCLPSSPSGLIGCFKRIFLLQVIQLFSLLVYMLEIIKVKKISVLWVCMLISS